MTQSGTWLKVFLSGAGANLSPPALPVPLPLRLQLHVRDGECAEAIYSPAGVIENSLTRFRALAD